MGLTGRSHAHLEASIAVLVLVETLVSHAKKARMTCCHVFSPVQFHSCTDAPLDFHPTSGPVYYLTTNYTAYLLV